MGDAVFLFVAGILELVRSHGSRPMVMRGVALILAGLIAAPFLVIII